MKHTTRRELFQKIFRYAGTATATGSVITAGHALLHQAGPEYPCRPARGYESRERLIRPPGALEEKAFLAACIRCSRCQDACERGAIRFFSEADGELFYTPHIDPGIKACNLCMACTAACPTGALKLLLPAERDKAAMGSVALKQDLCLSHKAIAIRREQAMLMEMHRQPTESQAAAERRGPCGECYMFCPLKNEAIQLDPGSFLAPIIFAQQCVGCGMCEEICREILRGDPAIQVVATRT